MRQEVGFGVVMELHGQSAVFIADGGYCTGVDGYHAHGSLPERETEKIRGGMSARLLVPRSVIFGFTARRHYDKSNQRHIR